MKRGWWRSNAVALVALALLIPAVVVIIGGNEWNDGSAGRPWQPIGVSPGESAAYGEAQIGPASAELISAESADDRELTVPDGMRVVVTTVRVDPGSPAISCLPLVLRERDGAQRQWNGARLEVDWPFDAAQPTSCDRDAVAPYSLVTPFLVPDDARGPFAVDIAGVDELPRFVRLDVAP